MALIHCAECNHKISDKASSCPQCGAPIEVISQITEPVSNEGLHVRKRVTQANINEEASGFWMLQVFVASAVAGFYQESWYVFGGALVALMMLPNIPILGHLAAIVLAAGVGLGGYWLGSLWSEEAGYVIGALLFLSALGANLLSIDWARDINNT